jgi:hypothetical protein
VLLVVVGRLWLPAEAWACEVGFACGRGLVWWSCLRLRLSKLLQCHSGVVAASRSQWFEIGFQFEVAAVGGARESALDSESDGCGFVD